MLIESTLLSDKFMPRTRQLSKRAVPSTSFMAGVKVENNDLNFTNFPLCYYFETCKESLKELL